MITVLLCFIFFEGEFVFHLEGADEEFNNEVGVLAHFKRDYESTL